MTVVINDLPSDFLIWKKQVDPSISHKTLFHGTRIITWSLFEFLSTLKDILRDICCCRATLKPGKDLQPNREKLSIVGRRCKDFLSSYARKKLRWSEKSRNRRGKQQRFHLIVRNRQIKEVKMTKLLHDRKTRTNYGLIPKTS